MTTMTGQEGAVPLQGVAVVAVLVIAMFLFYLGYRVVQVWLFHARLRALWKTERERVARMRRLGMWVNPHASSTRRR